MKICNIDDEGEYIILSSRRAAVTRNGKAQYVYSSRPRRVDKESRSHSRDKEWRRRMLEQLDRMGGVPLEIIMTRPVPGQPVTS